MGLQAEWTQLAYEVAKSNVSALFEGKRERSAPVRSGYRHKGCLAPTARAERQRNKNGPRLSAAARSRCIALKPDGTRTRDLRFFTPALYQLSYKPTSERCDSGNMGMPRSFTRAAIRRHNGMGIGIGIGAANVADDRESQNSHLSKTVLPREAVLSSV